MVGWSVLSAIAVAAVLYGAAQAGIRSAWFRKAFEERLSRATGMEVRVGGIRPTESLNLRIGDIRAKEDRATLEAKVLRVKWSFFAPHGLSRIRTLVVEDAVLTVVVPDDGDAPLPPTIAGGQVQELVSYLAQGRLQEMVAPRHEGEPPIRESDDGGGRTYKRPGGIGHVRVVRGAFSLCDANGRERTAANGVEIERTIGFDRDGRRREQWKVGAALLSSGGMRLTGLDWAAECSGDGPWNVIRFVSDGWSDCSSSSPAEDIKRATEQYRALLDSI